jgi:hypothetical protein
MKWQNASRKNPAHNLATLFLVKNKPHLRIQLSSGSAPPFDAVEEPLESPSSLESVSESETATSSL